MTSPTGPARTRPTRMVERVSDHDIEALTTLLDANRVAHVAFVSADAQPVVLPIAFARDGDNLLLHGSTASRWLRAIAQAIPVSVAVTSLDALVIARSAFESSMRYRSAVLFGRCRPVEDSAKQAALDLITEALLPGRVAELRRPTAKELAATLVLRFTVEDFTIKVAQGWPDDSPEDVRGSAWAGVLPFETRLPQAYPAPDLRPGIDLPESVRRLLGGAPA